MLDPADELSVAKKAIRLGDTTSGYCEWDYDEAERVRRNLDLKGLTPEYIRRRLIEHIAETDDLRQIREDRPQYRGKREFYYKAIFQEPGFKHGIFVESELTNDDEDWPELIIFNAHPQLKS